MALVNWSEKYATGVTEIDQQHRELFGSINELHEAMRLGKGTEVIGRTLEGLRNYVQTHFGLEEEKMLASGYPDLAAHRLVHRYFEEQVRQLLVKQRSGSLGTALETSRFLADWLQKHILDTDLRYVPWLKGEKKAA